MKNFSSAYEDSSEFMSEDNRKYLESKNSSLIKENNVLKAQFENAVSIGSRVEDVKQENDALHARLRLLAQENHQLKLRVELLQKSSAEEENKFKKERELMLQQHVFNEDETKKEVSKLRKKLATELRRASDEIEELSHENEALTTKLKENDVKAQRIFDALSYYLNRRITSYDQLLEIAEELSKTKNTAKQENDNIPTKDKDYVEKLQIKDENKYKKKIKALCEELKKKEAQIQELSVTAENYTKVSKENEANTHELLSLKRKLQETDEDKKLLAEDYEHQIKMLNLKIENLKTEINKRKDQSSMEPVVLTQPMTPFHSENSSTRKTIQEPEDDILYTELNARIADLSKNLSTVTQERNNLTEQMNQISNDFDKLRLEANKQHTDYDALAVVHEETLKELASLREALHSRDVKFNKREEKLLRKIEDETNSKLQHLQTIADSHKEQAYELQLSAAKQAQQISLLNAQIGELVKQNEVLKHDLKRTKENLEEQTRKANEKPPIVETDLIPATTWFFNGFDSNLSSKVDKIGKNPNLQTSSKIQAIFKEIAKYYSKRIQSASSESDQINDAFCKMKQTLSKFIVDLSIAATDSAMTLDDFMKGNGQVLVDNVFTIRGERDNLERVNKDLTSKLCGIKKAFGKECPKAYKEKTDRQIAELEKNLEKFERKYKKYKSNVVTMKANNEKNESENKALTEDMKNEISKLKIENDEYSTNTSNLKRQVQNLTNKLRESEHKLEEATNEYNKQVEELIRKGKEERLKVEAEMSDEIKRVTENLMMTSDNFEDSQTQITKLKNVIATQKAALDELVSDRDYQKKVAEIAHNSQEKKFELEKNQLIDSYEAAILELKEQCESLRKDVTKLSVELSKSDKSKKSARAQIAEMMNEKAELLEQLERAKSFACQRVNK